MTDGNVTLVDPKNTAVPRIRLLWLSISMAVLALFLLAGWWLGERQAEKLDGELRGELLRKAVDIAGSINPQLARRLTFTAGDKETAAFQRIRGQMMTEAAALKTGGVYSIALRNNRIFFGPESFPEKSPLSSPPGTEFYQPPGECVRIFASKSPVIYGPTTDEYGTFITAIAPVIDEQTDRVVLVVGVDVPVEDWEGDLRSVRLGPMIITGVLSILVLIAAVLSRWQMWRFQPESVKVRAWIVTPTALALLCAGVLYGVYEYHRLQETSRERMILDREKIQVEWRRIVSAQTRLLRGQLDELAPQPWMSNVWHVSDRGSVGELIHAAFRDMVRDQGVTQLTFMDPDGICRFRSHQPEQYGDTINRVVPRLAAWTGEDVWGIELGLHGLFALRYVRPWREDGRVRGLVEVGKDAPPLISRLSADVGVGTVMVLRKEYCARENVEAGRQASRISGNWEKYPDLVVAFQGMPVLPDEVDAVLREGFSAGLQRRVFRAHAGDHVYACSVFPMPDVLGRDAISIITLRDVTVETNAERGAVVLAFGLAVVLAMCVLCILWIVAGIVERRLGASFARVHESESRIRAITESAQDAIVMTDPGGRISFWNPAAERIFGYRSDEAIGHDLYTLIMPARSRDGDRAVLPRFPASGEGGTIGTMADLQVLRKDGSEVSVQLSLSAVLMADGWHSIGVIRDITDRKRMEAEKESALEDLSAAMSDLREVNSLLEETTVRSNVLADQAEAANRAKSQFLANMSHEIRTPMNGIIGMIGLLMESPLTTEQRQFAEVVHNSSEALLALINDILDFSKIEAGKIELESLDFDLESTLEDTAELLAVKAHQKGLNFVCLFDPDVPRVLRGDPGRLRQIVLNLGGNAVKFTHEGGITIRVSLVEDAANQATIRLAITDTGIGIPADKQGKLFAPFTQVDGSVTRKYGGTGLGLAISRQLVELMGGTIGIESPATPVPAPGENKGSTFWFTVVLEKSQNVDLLGSRPTPQLAGSRVLVVGDHAVDRLLLTTLLRNWACRYDEASDGATALALLEHAAREGDPYTLALLDMLMPVMDGAELGQRIKGSASICDTRMVMMTSLRDPGDRARMARIGFAAYLTKPLRQNLVRRTLEDVLSGVSLSAAEVPAATTVQSAGSSTARILVAEDNPVNQLVAMKMLGRIGYRADMVGNGREAVDALSLVPYDLILMDCQMPEMDGFDATRAIRGRDHKVPIIAMTANAMKGDRELCLEAGMNDYLSKPVRSAELAAALERWLPRATE